MSTITDLSRHFLVLSYGRSGSVLLATNMGVGLKTTPIFAPTNKEYIQHPVSDLSVVHSHLTLLQRQTQSYQRIFNLRRDPVETILSTLLSEKHNFYHQSARVCNKTHDPIEYNNWQYIEHICNDYLRWHQHYARQLTKNDFVVVYEDMISNLSNPNKLYRKTYPNKQELITNYSHVVWYITKHFKDNLVKINGTFLAHHNSCDIYSCLDI